MKPGRRDSRTVHGDDGDYFIRQPTSRPDSISPHTIAIAPSTMNPLASTSMLRTAVAASSRTTSRRCLSLTTPRHSHIGSAPLTIPTNVTLTLPAHSIPLSSTSANSPLRSISITGPLGSQTLPIAHPVVLHPPTTETPNQLSVTVQDPDVKAQKALWGLTRALLGNAVVGVSEGYRLVLRLVGVGYRASVEPIPPTLRRLLLQPRSPTHTPLTSEEAPVDRLNLKLGYAHPIYVDIPKGITVSTPQTTRIVLQGTDKQKLGLFAAKVRRWRKPEPYRGKVSAVTRSWTHFGAFTHHVVWHAWLIAWIRFALLSLACSSVYRVSLWETRRSRSRISRRSRRPYAFPAIFPILFLSTGKHPAGHWTFSSLFLFLPPPFLVVDHNLSHRSRLGKASVSHNHPETHPSIKPTQAQAEPRAKETYIRSSGGTRRGDVRSSYHLRPV